MIKYNIPTHDRHIKAEGIELETVVIHHPQTAAT
jgi:hypothetical protein